MSPHRLIFLAPILSVLLFSIQLEAKPKQKAPPGGRLAIVVDERLSALRSRPDLRATLIRRLGRGRPLAIKRVRSSPDGIVFLLVNASRRTQGWIQSEAVVVPSHKGDDARLLLLIKASTDFDRIVRARILLDYFPRSSLRSEVLLILGDTAEKLSNKLSEEAERRTTNHSSAPSFSFFLNYSGLDRYNRQGVGFVFDERTRRLHYDGAAWREIIRRYPRSFEAQEALRRLAHSLR
ncbi:MAG TPA: hypothetical protein VIX17_29620 [Pyrinomonadaceae bacterium]|jgi:hypothetical protein